MRALEPFFAVVRGFVGFLAGVRASGLAVAALWSVTSAEEFVVSVFILVIHLSLGILARFRLVMTYMPLAP